MSQGTAVRHHRHDVIDGSIEHDRTHPQPTQQRIGHALHRAALRSRLRGSGRAACLAFALVVAIGQISPPAEAFTQSGFGLGFGNGVPMGHEWLTRLAALELLGNDPVIGPDPNDPRRNWRQGLAKNPSLAGAEAEVARIRALRKPGDTRYQSAYSPVFDAIMGERWVDIAGFNAAKGMIGDVNCWDAVAQEAAEAQYDHFMRRYDDVGPQGGINAATQSQQRFIRYFVEAAVAPRTQMMIWDGGGFSVQEQVDRNYFLFGRAVHLFQDSFSTEHTVRLPEDNYTTIREVKSYLCAEGSEQHTHDFKQIITFTSGDVVWLPGTQLGSGWASYRPSYMKTPALVATEASKDLWAAFIRTMALPLPQREAAARREAQTLVNNWLSFDPNQMRTWYQNDGHRDRTYVRLPGQQGPGQSQTDCMKILKFPSQAAAVEKFQREQRLCLYNLQPIAGYADLYDPSVHMPFNWEWVSSTSWRIPPPEWQIPNRPADTGRRLSLRASDGRPLGVPGGVVNNSVVAVRNGLLPLGLVAVDAAPQTGRYFRSLQDPTLFLSYAAIGGAVKLYNSPSQATFLTEAQPNGRYALKNVYWNQWMWRSGDLVYITGRGAPGNADAQWTLGEP
jgi:hypothetical protein